MLISASEITVSQISQVSQVSQVSRGHRRPFMAPLQRSRGRRRARREDRIAELVTTLGRDWSEWADTSRASRPLMRGTPFDRCP
jgi:hypothetical protein